MTLAPMQGMRSRCPVVGCKGHPDDLSLVIAVTRIHSPDAFIRLINLARGAFPVSIRFERIEIVGDWLASMVEPDFPRIPRGVPHGEPTNYIELGEVHCRIADLPKFDRLISKALYAGMMAPWRVVIDPSGARLLIADYCPERS